MTKWCHTTYMHYLRHAIKGSIVVLKVSLSIMRLLYKEPISFSFYPSDTSNLVFRRDMWCDLKASIDGAIKAIQSHGLVHETD